MMIKNTDIVEECVPGVKYFVSILGVWSWHIVSVKKQKEVKYWVSYANLKGLSAT